MNEYRSARARAEEEGAAEKVTHITRWIARLDNKNLRRNDLRNDDTQSPPPPLAVADWPMIIDSLAWIINWLPRQCVNERLAERRKKKQIKTASLCRSFFFVTKTRRHRGSGIYGSAIKFRDLMRNWRIIDAIADRTDNGHVRCLFASQRGCA